MIIINNPKKPGKYKPMCASDILRPPHTGGGGNGGGGGCSFLCVTNYPPCGLLDEK